MAALTQPKPQKIDPTQVKNFWPGPITVIFISGFLRFLFHSDLGNVTYQSTLFLISHHVYYSNQLGPGTDRNFFLWIHNKDLLHGTPWGSNVVTKFLNTLPEQLFYVNNWSFGFWPLSPGRGPEKFQTLPMFCSVIFKGPELKFQPNWIIHHELRAPLLHSPSSLGLVSKKEQPFLVKKY